MGRKHGIATLLKESLPWLEVVRCINHSLELALKDPFQDIKSFQMIGEMLMKNYYHYYFFNWYFINYFINWYSLHARLNSQNFQKRLRELKVFSDSLEEAVPNLCKEYGTCWIDHKFLVMEILLSHYGT